LTKLHFRGQKKAEHIDKNKITLGSFLFPALFKLTISYPTMRQKNSWWNR